MKSFVCHFQNKIQKSLSFVCVCVCVCVYAFMCMCVLSCAQLFATLWTVAH